MCILVLIISLPVYPLPIYFLLSHLLYLIDLDFVFSLVSSHSPFLHFLLCFIGFFHLDFLIAYTAFISIFVALLTDLTLWQKVCSILYFSFFSVAFRCSSPLAMLYCTVLELFLSRPYACLYQYSRS